MPRKRHKEKPNFHRVAPCLYRFEHNGRYYFQGQINGRKYTQSLGTTDFTEAKRELLEKQRTLGRLDGTVAGRMTLAELCERWRHSFAHQKPVTVAQKERFLRRVLRDWPTGRGTPIGRIRPSDLDVWLAQYELGASGRNAYVWRLRDLFAMAVRDRALTASPAEHLRARRRPDPMRLTPTFEEFEAIIESVRSQRFNGHGASGSADFLEAQGLLGLGQAELRSLVRRDVRLERGQISVLRHKTGRRFTIPVYPQARPLIEKVCAGKKHNQRLFEICNAKKALAAACMRLGLPAYSQRSFRRMFITRAIERGIDVKVIASWQGHTDGGSLILKTYSHVSRPHAERMAMLMTTEEPENFVRMPAQRIFHDRR
jgi:integrase